MRAEPFVEVVENGRVKSPLVFLGKSGQPVGVAVVNTADVFYLETYRVLECY